MERLIETKVEERIMNERGKKRMDEGGKDKKAEKGGGLTMEWKIKN